MPTTISSIPPSAPGSPPWVIATLYPNQGHWSEEEYLELGERTNRIIEMSSGCVEVLDLPTKKHQKIATFFHNALERYLDPPDRGDVVLAAYPLKMAHDTFREPDVLFVTADHLHWFGEKFATGADGVLEVLSQDRQRDMETKRREYAEAGIPEYWMADARDRRITVLRLENGVYVVAGEYGPGEQAKSVVLEGFSVDVTAMLAAGD